MLLKAGAVRARLRAGGYLRHNWNKYAAAANEKLMAIALVEDAVNLLHIDEMATGIDACFVGPTDLAIALGVAGATFEDARLGAVLDKIVAAPRRIKKYAMTLIGNKLDADYFQQIARRGVQIIVLGTDADLLVTAIRFSSPRT